MIQIDHIPTDILDALTHLSTWFFSVDHGELNFDRVNKAKLEWEEAVSIPHLLKKQQQKDIGYPTAARGADFNLLEYYTKDFCKSPHVQTLRKYDREIRTMLGSSDTALMMYYPPRGFIDWHTNSNAYGYNAIFTYSKTGDGAFLYQNPTTKEIVTMKDKVGWNMKLGVFDKKDGAPIWHAAYTLCDRLTWSYIIPDNIWNAIVGDLNVDPQELIDMVGSAPSLHKPPSKNSMYHTNV